MVLTPKLIVGLLLVEQLLEKYYQYSIAWDVQFSFTKSLHGIIKLYN
jgi:hypothetical protein